MEDTTPENAAGGADHGKRGPGDDPVEIVVRRADVVATRPASRLPADRVRSALDTARRLARNPAVVASASAVGAVALREGVALARRAAVRQAAARPAQVPVVVVVNMMWLVHEHRRPDPAPGAVVVRVRAE